jgi:hypothetical protein
MRTTTLLRSLPLDTLARAQKIRKSMRKAKIAFLLSCTVFCSEAYALGAFSRACRFDQIPNGLQTIAATFFSLLGAPSWVLGLPNHQEKSKYWILESITTDYMNTRYYLGAKHSIYQWYEGNYSGWLHKMTRDSGLTQDALNPSVLTDERFKIFTNNRMLLFSARAGSSDIVERAEQIPRADPWSNRWRVVGQHYYYDPDRKRQISLTQTVAEDCNLKEGWPRP